jgi:hypothetical protein
LPSSGLTVAARGIRVFTAERKMRKTHQAAIKNTRSATLSLYVSVFTFGTYYAEDSGDVNNRHYCVRRSKHRENGHIIGSTEAAFCAWGNQFLSPDHLGVVIARQRPRQTHRVSGGNGGGVIRGSLGYGIEQPVGQFQFSRTKFFRARIGLPAACPISLEDVYVFPRAEMSAFFFPRCSCCVEEK